MRPSNAPLSAAVEALVGGGHVTTAVHDALGGVLPLVGDYIITRYGAWDMPCALELLRKHDGRTVQSITHFGVLTPPGR